MFLNEGVYEYRKDVEKPLMLESTDLYLSQNGIPVAKIQPH